MCATYNNKKVVHTESSKCTKYTAQHLSIHNYCKTSTRRLFA